MSKPFSYAHDFKSIDFRNNPEKYQIGRGEQGVMIVQPYSADIMKWWRFATPAEARKSADKIYSMYEEYKRQKDFVGMDVAKKFLNMGYTRSQRYFHYKGGKKYDGPVPASHKGESGSHGRATLPDAKHPDQGKRESALIFKAKWDQVRNDPDYQRMKQEFETKYGK